MKNFSEDFSALGIVLTDSDTTPSPMYTEKAQYTGPMVFHFELGQALADNFGLFVFAFQFNNVTMNRHYSWSCDFIPAIL